MAVVTRGNSLAGNMIDGDEDQRNLGGVANCVA